jgi:hypothetical protein
MAERRQIGDEGDASREQITNIYLGEAAPSRGGGGALFGLFRGRLLSQRFAVLLNSTCEPAAGGSTCLPGLSACSPVAAAYPVQGNRSHRREDASTASIQPPSGRRA